MTDDMEVFLGWVEEKSDGLQAIETIGSDQAAVGIKNLAIDPSGRTSQESHELGYVVGLSQSLERRSFGEVVDDLLGFAVEEEGCRRRAGCDRIDGDVSPAQLFGQDQGKRVNRALGGGIG